MTKKVPVCFTLKPENVRLLKEKSGIATASAYLDYLIEQYFLQNEASKN